MKESKKRLAAFRHELELEIGSQLATSGPILLLGQLGDGIEFRGFRTSRILGFSFLFFQNAFVAQFLEGKIALLEVFDRGYSICFRFGRPVFIDSRYIKGAFGDFFRGVELYETVECAA